MNTLLSDQNYSDNQALNFVAAPKQENTVQKKGGNVDLFDNEELIVWKKSTPTEYTSSVRIGNYGRDLSGNIVEDSNAESYPALLLYNTNENLPVLDIGVVPSASGGQAGVISFKKNESSESVEYASLRLDDDGNITDKYKGKTTEVSNGTSTYIRRVDIYSDENSKGSGIFFREKCGFNTNNTPETVKKHYEENGNAIITESILNPISNAELIYRKTTMGPNGVNVHENLCRSSEITTNNENTNDLRLLYENICEYTPYTLIFFPNAFGIQHYVHLIVGVISGSISYEYFISFQRFDIMPIIRITCLQDDIIPRYKEYKIPESIPSGILRVCIYRKFMKQGDLKRYCDIFINNQMIE